MKNKTQRKEDILKDARDLSNYTVQDMQSSLGCNIYSLSVWQSTFPAVAAKRRRRQSLGARSRRVSWANENSK